MNVTLNKLDLIVFETLCEFQSKPCFFELTERTFLALKQPKDLKIPVP